MAELSFYCSSHKRSRTLSCPLLVYSSSTLHAHPLQSKMVHTVSSSAQRRSSNTVVNSCKDNFELAETESDEAGENESDGKEQRIQSELDKLKIELFKSKLLFTATYLKSNFGFIPEYWDPFPQGVNHLVVDIINCRNKQAIDERDRIIQLFKSGGVTPNQIVSIKRIQHRDRWYEFMFECRKRHSLSSGAHPISKTRYLFHGPRHNTCNILMEGGLSTKYSKNRGVIWLHAQSSYSASLADQLHENRRMFICRVIEDAQVSGSEGGGIFTFNNDAHVFAEYLIQWR